jgi:uncharacterized membrane protein YphA (DoxX/SURF4 family)
MKRSEEKRVEWFLRIALSAGFPSAVADRFGWWPANVSAWGNWSAFVGYTQSLLPWLPANLAEVAGGIATFLEIALGVGLLMPYKTSLIAKCSGVLLVLFALAMTMSKSLKAPLDYSVLTAAAAAFALSVIIAHKAQ